MLSGNFPQPKVSPDFMGACKRTKHDKRLRAIALATAKDPFLTLHSSPQSPATGFISVVLVTSQQSSATRLTSLLEKSQHVLHVEWIGADQHCLNSVEALLAQKSTRTPSIVLLDFQSCGASVWEIISHCARSNPDLTVEWVITGHSGTVPDIDQIPWHQVTIIPSESTIH